MSAFVLFCPAFMYLDEIAFQSAIIRNNPEKYLRSVGDNETVEFDVVEGEKVREIFALFHHVWF